ncbi:MAG TPA: TolC family protein [Caulobacteraceae bacterium]|nr:TolC family protein [Caulobacteraceae bacterium]
MNRLALPIGCLLLLTACVESRVRAPVATPPVAYEAPRPADGGLASQALDRWWTLYGDDQLNRLVGEALNNAPDARTAMAVLQQAAAVRKQTLDKIYIPSEIETATATHSQATDLLGQTSVAGEVLAYPGSSNAYIGAYSVSWELDLWGRRAAAGKAANADLRAASFTYEASRTALIAQVADDLFQARGLALQMQDAEDTSRIDRDLEKIAEAKRDAGLATIGEVEQAKADAEAADAAAESLRAQEIAAQRALLVLIGHGFDKLETLPVSSVVGSPPAVPATLPGDLLRRRPDVKAAEWKIVSAAGTLKLDDLTLLPTINLDPGYAVTKTTGPFGYASEAWSVGSGLTVPILDRPRLIAGIHAQRAVAEQAVIAYESAVQQAYGDAETAFTYLDSDRKRVRTLTDAERSANTAYVQARTEYTEGLDDLTSALQAEATWRGVKTQLTSAQISLMQRTVQVFKALGGGWAPEEIAALSHPDLRRQ